MKEFKILLRENVAKIEAIKQSGEDRYIPLDNMEVEASGSDPKKVVLLAREDIIKLIESLKDSRFSPKYVFEYESSDGYGFTGQLPTAGELENIYVGANGWSVKDLAGNPVKLKRGGGTGFAELKEGDGITIINIDNGEFDVAGYQAGKILISDTKAALPNQLSTIISNVSSNAAGIAANKSAANSLTQKISVIEDKPVITNSGDVTLKNMAGKLVQDDKYSSEQASQDSKISALETDNTTNKGKISKLEQTSTNQASAISTLESENTTNKGKISTLEQTSASQAGAISTLESDNTANKTAITTNTTNNATQQTAIDSNVSRITALESTVSGGGPTSPVLDTITDLWTNSQKFEKYKDDILKVTAANGSIAFITFFNAADNYRYASSPSSNGGTATYIDSTQPDKIDISNSFVDVSKVEIIRVLPVANLAQRSEVISVDNKAGQAVAKATANESDINSLTPKVTAVETKAGQALTKANANQASLATVNNTLASTTTKATQALTKATANESALTTANNNINTKQDKIDNSLTTASKSVIGGINELKAYADSINLNHNSLDNQFNAVKGSVSSAGGNKRDADEFDGSTQDKTLASEYFVENSHVAKKLLGLRKQSDLYNDVSQNMWYWVMLEISGLSTPVLVFCYHKDGSIARFHLPELYYPSGYTVINQTITISKTNTTAGTTGIPGLSLGSNDVRLTRTGSFTPNDDSVLRKQEIDNLISASEVSDSHINSLADSRVSHALSKTMHITFDDGSSNDYKIGD